MSTQPQAHNLAAAPKHQRDYVLAYTPLLVYIPTVLAICTVLHYTTYKSGLTQWLQFRRLSTKVWQTRWYDHLIGKLRQDVFALSWLEFIVIITFFGVYCIHAVMISNTPLAVGNASGHWSAVFLALAIYPIQRHSVLTPLLGTSFERLVKYHRWCGALAILLGWAHCAALGLVKYQGRSAQFWALFTHKADVAFGQGSSQQAGAISLLLMTASVLLSVSWIRRRAYNLFYFQHAIVMPVALGYAMYHSLAFRYASIPVWILYGADKLYGFWLCNIRATKLQAVRYVRSQGHELVQLKVWKNHFQYHAGQYVWLNVPQLHWLAWHPFSISSTPVEDHSDADNTFVLSIVVPNAHDAAGGDQVFGYRFARGLRNLVCDLLVQNAEVENKAARVEATEAQTRITTLKQQLNLDNRHRSYNFESSWCALKVRPLIRVEGPSGTLQVQPYRYPVVVLVAGGAGITPILPIACALAQQMLASNSSSSKSASFAPIHIHLIWTVRHRACIDKFFDDQLSELMSESLIGKVHLHLYATQAEMTAAESTSNLSNTNDIGNRSDSNLDGQCYKSVFNTQDADGIEVCVDEKQESSDKLDDGVVPSNAQPLLQHTYERPNIALLLNAIANQHRDILRSDAYTGIGRSGACMLSCGPEALQADAQTAALKKGWHVHAETFGW